LIVHLTITILTITQSLQSKIYLSSIHLLQMQEQGGAAASLHVCLFSRGSLSLIE